jgi:hypothetical protein
MLRLVPDRVVAVTYFRINGARVEMSGVLPTAQQSSAAQTIRAMERLRCTLISDAGVLDMLACRLRVRVRHVRRPARSKLWARLYSVVSSRNDEGALKNREMIG